MIPLTPKQQRVLDYLVDYIAEKRYGPTYDEIGRAIGVSSKNTVFAYMEHLAKKGYIAHNKRGVRDIRIVGRNTMNDNISEIHAGIVEKALKDDEDPIRAVMDYHISLGQYWWHYGDCKSAVQCVMMRLKQETK